MVERTYTNMLAIIIQGKTEYTNGFFAEYANSLGYAKFKVLKANKAMPIGCTFDSYVLLDLNPMFCLDAIWLKYALHERLSCYLLT